LAVSKSPHIWSTVRHVTCYFEKFDARNSFKQGAKANLINHIDGQSDENRHSGHQPQELLAISSDDVASLAAALRHFQNLHTVRILEDLNSTFDDWFLLDRVFADSRAGQALFEALTSSLFDAGLAIERLVLGSFNGDSPALVGIFQGLDLAKQELYQRAFSKLKCLEILLPMVVHHEDNGFTQMRELNYEGLSALIQSAPLLEELRLAFDMPSQNTVPSCFVDSLQIPNLHTLRLATVRFQDPSCLIRFCREHAATLKRVEFSELCLQTGSWESVFTGLRDALQLESVILPGRSLVGGPLIEGLAELYWPRSAGEGCRVVSVEAIESFIRRTGENSIESVPAEAGEHGSYDSPRKRGDPPCKSLLNSDISPSI
jgi:hypothetical protein